MSIYRQYSCGCRELSSFSVQDDVVESVYPFSCTQCKLDCIVDTEIDFVRFGDFPDDGISQNYRDKIFEKGVSVYQLKGDVIDFVGWHHGFIDRVAYKGKGRVVGLGSDGEPLIDYSTARYRRLGKSGRKRYGI